jgi:hypothetical protein
MRRGGTLAAAAVLVLATAVPARADITGFLGASTTPANRNVKGVAVGAGLLIVGVEFEYAVTAEDEEAAAPALKTGMGNVLLQTPGMVFGFQPYYTVGAGVYRETLGDHQDTSFGLNTGGGVKIELVGPLRLRLDYRVFKLGNDALESPTQRVYAGLNLAF